jgi:hypothetical protein
MQSVASSEPRARIHDNRTGKIISEFDLMFHASAPMTQQRRAEEARQSLPKPLLKRRDGVLQKWYATVSSFLGICLNGNYKHHTEPHAHSYTTYPSR